MWWYRHPGRKRPDFSPGGDRLPLRISRGQPKTFAQALAALAEARSYAAQLEVLARQQQGQDLRLRNRVADLAHALTDTRSKARGGQEALRDKLEADKQQLAEIERREQAAVAQVEELREQAEGLIERIKKTEGGDSAHQATAERAFQEVTELRKVRDKLVEQHTQEASELNRSREELRGRVHIAERTLSQRDAELKQQRVVGEIHALTVQRDQLAGQRDSLNRQHAELTRSRDELRGRLDTTERSLSHREGELKQQRQNFAAAERAYKEVHIIAESESRSLRIEKERRIAAEQRIEQLTRDLERMAQESQVASSREQETPLVRMRDDLLAAELKEVRQHRDDAIAERELLTARILKLMAPGQYLEHAAAAGYDLTKDPLIRLKREEVLIENRLAAWQELKKKRRRARRLDPEQTLDEQAYAAALSFRWKQIDHPHLRRKQQPRWIAVGFLLDAESERYLLTLTEERIEEMKKKMGQAA